MGDLIDRQAAIAEVLKGTITTSDLYGMGVASGMDVALERIKSVPNVDAVEVVRCKDCDKSVPSDMMGCGWRFCMNNSQHHKDKHFCSYGERRTDA